MAFRAAQPTVNTTAMQLIAAVAGDVEAWVEVTTGIGADAVYLGGDSAVTTSNGFRLQDTDNILNVRLRPGDELWAIAGASRSVNVLIRSA